MSNNFLRIKKQNSILKKEKKFRNCVHSKMLYYFIKYLNSNSGFDTLQCYPFSPEYFKYFENDWPNASFGNRSGIAIDFKNDKNEAISYENCRYTLALLPYMFSLHRGSRISSHLPFIGNRAVLCRVTIGNRAKALRD